MMKNKTTTIEILFAKEVCSEKNSKSLRLSLKDKIADSLSSLMSQVVVSIVVAVFILVIKIKPFKCLSGFYFHNKSKA